MNKHTQMIHMPSYAGKLLTAMPHNTDVNFQHSVVFISSHDSRGATGLIVNRILDGLSFKDLLQQVDIAITYKCQDQFIAYGGPMDIRRGLVLHSLDYITPTTEIVNEQFGVTATVEILKAMGRGQGPIKSFVSLGFSGWNPGQLELEIAENQWFVTEANEMILFDLPLSQRWRYIFGQVGIDLSHLSLDLGHA